LGGKTSLQDDKTYLAVNPFNFIGFWIFSLNFEIGI
jgi:hypothetical protein